MKWIQKMSGWPSTPLTSLQMAAPAISLTFTTRHRDHADPHRGGMNAHVWGEEFHACVIEQAEFEAAWESHTYDGALKESGGF